ncbi:hypothetical protein FHS21_005122 [Phyllobacterium trifolii]|uniref:Uncharacterized protein n=1 Tax=Phyllobacterium trifolii TaxID=300193 RepID=A0A839UFT7_9HYPH|nr:hypothetical protein [Phyllobacterium trifolii]MBB3148674.1 hypothetical protein [Phyllobacterium trifolii]
MSRQSGPKPSKGVAATALISRILHHMAPYLGNIMGSNMPQRLDHKLDCKTCGTIYLQIPENVQSHTPIYCSSCGELLGRWDKLELDFNQQGGHNGVFEMRDGQIIRKE